MCLLSTGTIIGSFYHAISKKLNQKWSGHGAHGAATGRWWNPWGVVPAAELVRSQGQLKEHSLQDCYGPWLTLPTLCCLNPGEILAQSSLDLLRACTMQAGHPALNP